MAQEKSGMNRPEIRGLASSEVQRRRDEFGANIITPPARDPWWKLFLEKFDDPVIRILMLAAGIAIALGIVHGEYLEGLGIIVAVLLATTLAFWNEYTAAKEFDILNQVNDRVPIKVIRDGVYASVPRCDLVVGDVVLVEAGEEVPADGILRRAISMQTNEAGLTGEAEPNTKVARDATQRPQESDTAYPPDMVLRSSLVLDGHGTFEVTAVGDRTEIGQTARAAAEKVGQSTPLSRQLERLSKLIGVVGLLVASGTFTALTARGILLGELDLNASQWTVVGVVALGVLVGLTRIWLPMVQDGLELVLGQRFMVERRHGGFPSGMLRHWMFAPGAGASIIVAGLAAARLSQWISASPADWVPAEAVTEFLTYFMIGVTIIVVAVPEGLAMSVTLSLAYSMRKMTASNTLVRKMHACETIGAATVICSDKTGTLTMNEMRVFDTDFPARGPRPLADDDPVGALIIESLSVNTTAHLGRSGATATHALGNPTEGALLFWLDDHGVDYVQCREAFPVNYQLTFSTERKWMGTLGNSPRTHQAVFHAKGAPEVILARCTHVLSPGGREPLDDHRESIEQRLAAFQSRGMRTLGMAFNDQGPLEGDPQVEQMADGMTWLGFVAIADPVRSEVPPAIQACRLAGIQVKMVTGDNHDTAQEIARQIGLWTGDESPQRHLAGAEFQAIDDDQIGQVVSELKILSRAKPLDKVRLVRELRAIGHVVAVTGDGINDCGALNHADVGLAMGRTGKDAAKEASDIVLLDDSFRTIVNAVMWGRSLYQNIQRFILFQLTINVTALMIALLGPFLGIKLPLTVIQMLWVNLIMDTLAALALATEPPHREVMSRPPRSPKEFIVTRSMAARIFWMAGFFLAVSITLLLVIQADGQVTAYELSVFFTVFVLMQVWNLFNVRCLGSDRSAFHGILENKAFLTIAAMILLGQIAIVQWGGEIFRTVPLAWQHWLVILSATSLVLVAGELVRWRNRCKGAAVLLG